MSTRYKQAIITGGTGYLASNLINDKKFRVLFEKLVLISRQNKAENISEAKNIEFMDLNLNEKELDLKIIRNTEILIHSAHLRNIDQEKEFLSNFKNKKLVYFSSSAVYGDTDEAKESLTSDEPNPISDYGFYKLEIEDYIKENFEDFLILRISNPIGGSNLNRNIYQIFKSSIEKGLEISINSEESGQIIRDFIYMPEFIKQVTNLIKEDEQGVFNISSGKARTLESLLEEICQEQKQDFTSLTINYKGFKEGDIRRSVLRPG